MTEHDLLKRALNEKFRLSVDIEVQMTSSVKSEPLRFVVHKAREQAIEALAALVEADPAKPDDLRKLQNEVRRFNELCEWLKEALIEGPEAERQLNDMQIAEAQSAIFDDDVREQLDLPNRDTHDDD